MLRRNRYRIEGVIHLLCSQRAQPCNRKRIAGNVGIIIYFDALEGEFGLLGISLISCFNGWVVLLLVLVPVCVLVLVVFGVELLV